MSLESLSPEEFDGLARQHLKTQLNRRQALMLGAGTALGALAMSSLPAFAQSRGGTLRIGRGEEPDTLDPHKTALVVSALTMRSIFDSLVRYDFDGNVVPGLAERWEISNGNKTITFFLKPDVKFHDGTPADAHAMAYSIERILDPATASTSTSFLGPIDHAEVVDDLTIALVFKEPYVAVWLGLTLPYTAPVSRKAVEELGADFGRKPVGTGPFRFGSWSTDRGIRLERNEDYKVGPLALADAVEFVHYPEDATRMAALETGEINIMQTVPLDAIRRLRDTPGLVMIERPAAANRAVAFNVSRAPIDNLELRRAIAHAIDPEQIVAFAMDGNAVVATEVLGSSVPLYNKDIAALATPYDPEKAKAILAEIGMASGLTLDLLCNDTPPIRRSAEIVQKQLKDVGITLNVRSVPSAEARSLAKKAEHHLSIETYGYTDADIVYLVFHPKGALYRTFQQNPELDALIEKQRVTFDAAERQVLLDQIQTIVLENVYWRPIFEPINFTVTTDKVQGAQLTIDGDIVPATISVG